MCALLNFTPDDYISFSKISTLAPKGGGKIFLFGVFAQVQHSHRISMATNRFSITPVDKIQLVTKLV